MQYHLVIVHRYDEPERFGLHTDMPHPRTNLKPGVFWAVGLFDDHGVRNRIDEGDLRDMNIEVDPADFDLEKLINCAPIEWHSAMRRGEMLDRFQVFTSPVRDTWHNRLLDAAKE